MKWTYNNSEYDPDILDIKGYEGFVYLITNIITNQKYVGKKHFWTRRKDKKTGKRQTRESDWRDYYSSSQKIKDDVKIYGAENFKREILHLCAYALQMTYLEQKEQWDRNVLLTEDYYNDNIGGKFFVSNKQIFAKTGKKITTKNAKWREMKAEKMKGDNNIAKRDDVRKKISEKKKGEKHHQWNKPISEEHLKALKEGHRNKVAGVPKTQEFKNMLSVLRKEMKLHWWTDGINSIQQNESPGEGWRRGRVMKKKQ